MSLLERFREFMGETSDFETFWAVYPRKVGKLAAMKAYAAALHQTTPETILRGVERYTRTKPGYADWCHPVTFLRQGRWLDESASWVAPGEWRCPHTPPCHARQWCQSGARDERDRMRR